MRRSSIAPDLPPLAVAFSRCLPSSDRESIVGDLLEDADDRDLSGARLTLWLCAQLAAIAAGFALDGARTALTMPLLREMVSGIALDGSHAFRGALDTPRATLLRLAIFSASVATLAIAAGILVGALFSAAGLRAR